MRFWLGGYSADMNGAANGIGVLLAGAVDDALAGGSLGFAGEAVTTGGSPSWLAYHPTLEVVYAALEGAGLVQAFRRTGEASFTPLGAPVEAGESVCHIAVAPDAGSLIASCWRDGRVVRMTLDAAGRPSAPAIARRRPTRTVRMPRPPPQSTSTSPQPPARCAPPRARSTPTSFRTTTSPNR